MRFHIGCSGWSYKHWRNDFYPRGLPASRWFEHYSDVFDTVELNASFYRLPSESAVRSWRERAPEGFVFSVKGSRLITHFRRLRDVEAALDTFLGRMQALDAHLGPLLFQLPPDFAPDLPRLDAFLELVPRRHRCAFEFRNREWWTQETFRVLEKHGTAFCMYNAGQTTTPVVATAPFAYVRFHGPSASYASSYSDDALARWMRELQGLEGVETVYAYFNNDIGGHAPRDALRMRAMVWKEQCRETKRPVNDRPLTRCFGSASTASPAPCGWR
jgi:uncharacterized protein YecE (DUF72 family)